MLLTSLWSYSRPWSGPLVRPVFNADGISAFEIDGVASAPQLVVGNTQGIPGENLAAWNETLTRAERAGVRIIGVCPAVEDLSGPSPILSNHTRAMVAFVLARF